MKVETDIITIITEIPRGEFRLKTNFKLME